MTATLKDIAQRTGVSIAAVSMALKDHPRIGAARRKAIQAVARELGYQPDMMAQTMRSQRSNAIGMLMSNMRVTAASIRSDMMEQAISRNGYRVHIAFTQGETQRTIHQIRMMRSLRVEGLILHSEWPSVDQSLVKAELRLCSFPVVQVDSLAKPVTDDIVQIALDRSGAMVQLVHHLASRGRRDILYLTPQYQGTGHLKLKGVYEACQSLGLRLRCADNIHEKGWITPEQAMVNDNPNLNKLANSGVYSGKSMRSLVNRMVRDVVTWRDLPDAIVASNDETAMIAVAALKKYRGLRVPEDISVTGYDDIPAARLFMPSLTTVREPRKTLARTVTNTLMNMLAGKDIESRLTIIKPKPIIRHSS